MKKLQVLFVALAAILFIGSAQTAMAQKRNTLQGNTNYPAVVNGHLAFMGIPINTPEENLRKQLFSKGFKVYKNEWGQEFPETLVGMYKGWKMTVQTGYNEISLFQTTVYPDADNNWVIINGRSIRIYNPDGVVGYEKARGKIIKI